MSEIKVKTGIYIAYPTTPELKSIYRPKSYKTMVNERHTKAGIAKESFGSREKGYVDNFDGEVVFRPIAVIAVENLKPAEDVVLSALKAEFKRVGRSREWFATSNHERVIDIITATLAGSSIRHDLII